MSLLLDAIIRLADLHSNNITCLTNVLVCTSSVSARRILAHATLEPNFNYVLDMNAVGNAVTLGPNEGCNITNETQKHPKRR